MIHGTADNFANDAIIIFKKMENGTAARPLSDDGQKGHREKSLTIILLLHR